MWVVVLLSVLVCFSSWGLRGTAAFFKEPNSVTRVQGILYGGILNWFVNDVENNDTDMLR